MEQQTNNKNNNVDAGLASALKGEYQIDIKAVLSEAWQLTGQHRKVINLSMLIVFVIGTLATLLVMNVLGGYQQVSTDPKANLILQLIITIVVSPLLASIDMMGVSHSVGLKTSPKLLTAFLGKASFVILCALIAAVLTNLGFALFVLPGLYLAVALNTVMPLVLDKGLSPLKAVLVSIQATRFQWFKLFAIYVFLLILLIAASFPMLLMASSSLGIIGLVIFIFALSYLTPMFYHCKGIIYREIFGTQHSKTVKSTENNNTFSA